MAINASGLLFDITTRLGLFVEGVKAGQTEEFNAVLAAVDEQVRKLLGRIKYETLDGLTKLELNKLLVSLRRSQLEIYSAYTSRLIKQLQEFSEARISVTAIAYASALLAIKNDVPVEQVTEAQAIKFIQEESDLLPFAPLFGIGVVTGKVSLWGKIGAAPIPANGLYLQPFIQTFSRSAQATVENTIRKAYANKLTVAETIAELNGARTVQGNSSQFAKLALQANAVIETAVSHVDQISAQAVLSAIFSRYQWVSIIDGSTTAICRERDDMVFRYGQGPVPPAHYRCRSITVPLVSLFSDFKTPTLYAWLKRQPYRLQVEFLGKGAADALNSGEISAKEFNSLQFVKALSIGQFKSRLGLILT